MVRSLSPSRRLSPARDRKRRADHRSDSDSDDDARRKEKKKHRKSKRDHKKHKKPKKKRSRDASDSSSENESDRNAQRVDLERAAEVVRTLLVEFPAIASDLLALLQMMDDGETAMISGIANTRVKTLLRELFPLLGLKKLRRPEDAYVARKEKKSRGPGLLETVATMLTSTTEANVQNDEEEHSNAVTEPQRRRVAPIGPMMPPGASTTESKSQEADDDEEVVGPALPGMKGFRVADERVEVEMARRAQQLEEDEWRRARGEAPAAMSGSTNNGGREAWMTEMPTNDKIFSDAMGPMKPRTGQPAAFRSKEPAKIDSTWFDSPEERERAKRAKLDVELLGYIRPENAPAPRSGDQAARQPSAGPSVNESIMPLANPEADEDMRRQMDVLKQKRGPSLLEQHQQKVADQQKAKAGSDGAAERSTWNRERDLTARRGLSQADADRIISASKEIGSKFTAPTVTRQFL